MSPRAPANSASVPPLLSRERACHAVADRFLGLSSPEDDAVASLLISVDPASQAEAAAAEAYLVHVLGNESLADRFERLVGRPFSQIR